MPVRFLLTFPFMTAEIINNTERNTFVTGPPSNRVAVAVNIPII